MSDLPTDLLVVLLVSLLATAAVMTATALRARAVNRVAVVDVAWGLGFVVVAVVSLVVGLVLDGGADFGSGGGITELRRWIVPALASAWGVRLAWHIRRRALGPHAGAEDPRYVAHLGGTLDEVGLGVAVRKVFAVQGAAVWFVSLPVQVAAVTDVGSGSAWSVLVWAGAAVWLLGFCFEAIGDAQLAAYKADPDRGPVMDRGLWAWTRHPNYFGDACIWWGLWLAGALASGWWGLLLIVAPLAMTYFLVFATGARLLERSMMQRNGYPAYAARTSMFVPAPPGSRMARLLSGT